MAAVPEKVDSGHWSSESAFMLQAGVRPANQLTFSWQQNWFWLFDQGQLPWVTMETLDLEHKAMFKAANRPKRFQMILPRVLMSVEDLLRVGGFV